MHDDCAHQDLFTWSHFAVVVFYWWGRGVNAVVIVIFIFGVCSSDVPDIA